MKNVLFYAFQGEAMCFNHIMLNAIDMHNKNIKVGIIIEGKATALVKELLENENKLFKEVVKLGLIDSICKACSNQMGVLDYLENNTQLPINGDLMGHPPIEPYIRDGYEIITL